MELTVEQYAENFGMVGYVDKPVIMGEAGAFTFAYESAEVALPAVARWIADSCALGWDGWLYWEFYRPSIADDATWGFTDGENALMDGLAPVNNPDPCNADAIAPLNLALGQPAARRRSFRVLLPPRRPTARWTRSGSRDRTRRSGSR